MELIAAIKGLEALNEPCSVELFSDSEYLVKAMTQGWVDRWKSKGWRRKKNRMAANHDLWKKLDAMCQIHLVGFQWVKGHANIKENERCDQLATQARQGDDLLVDEFFERTSDLDPHAFQAMAKNLSRNDQENSHVKITQEGQPCRKCGTPVVKRIPKRKHKPGQTYYFAFYLYCPGCRTMYQVEDARKNIEEKRLL
jgi:ribonuclease HI